jgi:hypothetical protein
MGRRRASALGPRPGSRLRGCRVSVTPNGAATASTISTSLRNRTYPQHRRVVGRDRRCGPRPRTPREGEVARAPGFRRRRRARTKRAATRLRPAQKGSRTPNGHPRYQGVCFAAATPASKDRRGRKGLQYRREPRDQREALTRLRKTKWSSSRREFPVVGRAKEDDSPNGSQSSESEDE